MKLSVEYTIDLVSSANVHGKLRAGMNRTKRHREAAKFWLVAASRNQKLVPQLPCKITLTRYGIKKIDGHDNLTMAWKASVDGIACDGTRSRPKGFLEIDDGDPRLTWRYEQFVVPKAFIGRIKGQSRVKIEIEWDEP